MKNPLPDNPTVEDLHVYTRERGVSVPAGTRKRDLELLANSLRFDSHADLTAMVASLGGKFITKPCSSCGEPAESTEELCTSCLVSRAAADQAWRDHMNPPATI